MELDTKERTDGAPGLCGLEEECRSRAGTFSVTDVVPVLGWTLCIPPVRKSAYGWGTRRAELREG